MTNEELILEMETYEKSLVEILTGFRDYHIRREDDALLRQIVRELIDLFNDALGRNVYSNQIALCANISETITSP